MMMAVFFFFQEEKMSWVVADAEDHKGFPADRAKTGGWVPAALILGSPFYISHYSTSLIVCLFSLFALEFKLSNFNLVLHSCFIDQCFLAYNMSSSLMCHIWCKIILKCKPSWMDLDLLFNQLACAPLVHMINISYVWLIYNRVSRPSAETLIDFHILINEQKHSSSVYGESVHLFPARWHHSLNHTQFKVKNWVLGGEQNI